MPLRHHFAGHEHHAASANNIAKAAYAIGFGGLAATERPAILLSALALLGFAAAAAFLG